MRPFHEMTADEIAQHRALWREGKAELWRGTTARPSCVEKDRRPVFSDHDAPTSAVCVQVMGKALAEVGSYVVKQPTRVLFEVVK